MPEDLDPEEEELRASMGLLCRQISAEQRQKFEAYAAEIFAASGLDLNTPATQDTPRRFIRALFDVTAGYDGDPKLLQTFETECRGGPGCRVDQVIEGPIRFFSLCEHHALPFYGHAYVGISPTRASSGSPSSRGSCACLHNAFPFRNGSVGRSLIRWWKCFSRTGWRSTWRPTSSAPKCGRPGGLSHDTHMLLARRV
jgi:hypothetical protein